MKKAGDGGGSAAPAKPLTLAEQLQQASKNLKKSNPQGAAGAKGAAALPPKKELSFAEQIALASKNLKPNSRK